MPDKQQWDKELEPLMKVLMGKKGIKSKSANEIGQRKRDYFRGRDFKKFLLDPKSEAVLKKKCSSALKVCLEGNLPKNDEDVEKLGAELMARNFCSKAVYRPLNPKSEDPNKPKKWPDRLQRVPNSAGFDVDGFYIIHWEGDSGMRHFLLGLMVAAVLLVCMFPVWPIWAKIGIWYLSVAFLSLYFGVLILRMVVYALFWIVGVDFWIFPNINDEYAGFLDSFQPLYSWDKRSDDILMLIVRFGSLAIVAVAADQISQTTSLDDVKTLITSSYEDVIGWGVDKLTALPGSDRANVPSLEALKKDLDEDNETEEAEADATVDAATADDGEKAKDEEESEAGEDATAESQ
jgi:translocation protein SEC62